MKRKAMSSLGLLVLAALLLSPVSADIAGAQVTPIPHAFYGNLRTTDGAPAPAGRVVTAHVDGKPAGDPLITIQAGKFGGPDPLTLKLIVQGDISNGTPIQFYVDGVLATPGDPELANFKSGDITELDLTYKPPPVAPPPVTPPPVDPEPPVPPLFEVTLIGFTATVPLWVDAEGKVQETTWLFSEACGLWLFIVAGTRLLDADGNPLTLMSAEFVPSPPPPPPGAILLLHCNLGPDGATFQPAIPLIMQYEPDDLPEGVAEKDLYIAYWDGTAWRVLPSTVDTAENTVTSPVSHFTIFALISPLPVPVVEYDLTISSTEGGSVTTPGEGTFTYEEGTRVSLEAQAEEGYRFVNWTGDVDTIADVNAASTTITINSDYSITAEFEAVRPFPWWWIVIGVAVAGVLVYFLWWRRRKRAA